jgi:hypothetical protein
MLIFDKRGACYAGLAEQFGRNELVLLALNGFRQAYFQIDRIFLFNQLNVWVEFRFVNKIFFPLKSMN